MRSVALAFEHLLHQVDASARPVEFVAEQLVGRAVAVQKPQCTQVRRMVSASSPAAVPRMKSARWSAWWCGVFFLVRVRRRSGSEPGVQPAGIEDAVRIEGALEFGLQKLRESRRQRLEHPPLRSPPRNNVA